MAHWHDFNPWAGTLTYVPDLDELADCLMYPESRENAIAEWLQYGTKVDAYVLPPSPRSGLCESGGVRFGREGRDYFSSYFDSRKLTALWRKYAGGVGV